MVKFKIFNPVNLSVNLIEYLTLLIFKTLKTFFYLPFLLDLTSSYDHIVRELLTFTFQTRTSPPSLIGPYLAFHKPYVRRQ